MFAQLMKVRAFLPLAMLLASGCRSPSLTAADLAGCYEAILGPWDRTPDQDRVLTPPATIRLDTVEFIRGDGYVVLRAVPDIHFGGPRSHRVSWSLYGDADSIAIVWSSGYTGLALTLSRLTRNGGRGTAVAFHDNFKGPDPRAPVRLRRKPCVVKRVLEPIGFEVGRGETLGVLRRDLDEGVEFLVISPSAGAANRYAGRRSGQRRPRRTPAAAHRLLVNGEGSSGA